MNPHLFSFIYRNPQQKLLKTQRFSTFYIYVKRMMFCRRSLVLLNTSKKLDLLVSLLL